MDCARLSCKNSMASARRSGAGTILLCSQLCLVKDHFWRQPTSWQQVPLWSGKSLKRKKARNCDSGGDPKERWGLSPLCPARPPAYWAMNPLWRPELEASRILILSPEFWLRGQFLPGLEISNFDSESLGWLKNTQKIFFCFFFVIQFAFKNYSFFPE